MKITIEINPDEDNENMAYFTFKQKGKDKNMAVLRATARMMRVIGTEFSNMKGESDYIESNLVKADEWREKESVEHDGLA